MLVLGSSRLSAILGMMFNNCDGKFLTEGENLELKVRFFEFCTPANEKGPRSLDVLNVQTGPRLFFTHFGAEAAAPSLFKNKAKVLNMINFQETQLRTKDSRTCQWLAFLALCILCIHSATMKWLFQKIKTFF